MKLKAIWTLALLCTVAQGFGAEDITDVSTEVQLTNAISQLQKNIRLTGDIQLSNYLNINGLTVTIDLNGHKLSRSLSSSSNEGHVFWANSGSHLTIKDSSDEHRGTIEGGNATNGGGINVWAGCSVIVNDVTFKNNNAGDNGGAIFVRRGANVILSNVTFIGNTANDHGGAIWNNGTVTATNCTFTNNTASDVGAIYNSVVTDEGAGTATLTSCTFTGNKGTAGAGALANALGETVMTIDGCTIQDNTAGSNGGGIWNGGTLNMKGAVTVTGNKRLDGTDSNVFLKFGKVITVTGDLTGSSIGVEMENITGTFTSGLEGKEPSVIFTPDFSNDLTVDLDGNEACLITKNPVYYVERSWDATNKQVVSTEKRLMGFMIDGEDIPLEGEYKVVTNAPDDSPNEWFRMGGYSNNVAEYYVVRENVIRETIVVLGKNVHLILCDGVTLTLTGGLKLEDDHKLYIHCRSYGTDMGRLMVTNKYEKAAGIGSAQLEGKEKTVGELIIHGGHIEVTGGDLGAGIGSCARIKDQKSKLCNSVIVYGGYVKATGGKNGAGIGGGSGYYYNGIDGGKFVLYDGEVVAQGGIYAAGLGGGGSWCKYIDQDGYGGYGDEVIVYGGSLTASGGKNGAGIGSGNIYSDAAKKDTGGTLRIYGGAVTATGGFEAAGIGGGRNSGGANVYIYDGTVLAIGGNSGAAIGGGRGGMGFVFHISGGTVTAIGGENASGIGGGQSSSGGDVTIIGGTVIAKAGIQGDTGNRAIGPGKGSDKYGTLVIDDKMMVGAGNNGSVERIYDADERKNACWYRSYAEISPCTHPSEITYTINEDVTHTSHCKHCSLSETAKHSYSDDNGTCICGYKGGEGYFTITIATSRDGAYYEGVGIMVKVGKDKPYTLPVCSTIPDGYDFVGWAVNPSSHSGIRPIDDETLLQAGENITVTGNVSIFARYKNLTISLADDSDNAETLYNYNGKKNASVTLTGRTLWKDGGWNTLCLPFSLTEDQVTAQLAPGELKTLKSSEFAGGTLTLTFEDATTIEAGKPYIVKWAATTPDYVENPAFSDVTINDSYTPVETDYVDFVGTFSPIDIFTEEKISLYLGADNKLYYPSGEDSFIINSFRAYFELKEGLTAGEPVSTSDQPIKSFVLNFGEETGIEEVNGYGLRVNGYGSEWCTLDGRRLGSKPSSPGLYIQNGRKILIK